MIGNSPRSLRDLEQQEDHTKNFLVHSQTPSLDQQGNPCPLLPVPGRVTTGVTDALP